MIESARATTRPALLRHALFLFAMAALLIVALATREHVHPVLAVLVAVGVATFLYVGLYNQRIADARRLIDQIAAPETVKASAAGVLVPCMDLVWNERRSCRRDQRRSAGSDRRRSSPSIVRASAAQPLCGPADRGLQDGDYYSRSGRARYRGANGQGLGR